MKKIKIYVAAPITGTKIKNSVLTTPFQRMVVEGHHWRLLLYKKLKKYKQVSIIDPLRYDFRTKEESLSVCKKIVDKNKRDITSVDVIITNTNYCSWGTAMEICYTLFNNSSDHQPSIWIVHESPLPPSPWIKIFEDSNFLIFRSEKDLFQHMDSVVGEETSKTRRPSLPVKN